MFTWTTNVGKMTGQTFMTQNASGVTGYVKVTSGLVSGYASATIMSSPIGLSTHILIGAIAVVLVAGLLLARKYWRKK